MPSEARVPSIDGERATIRRRLCRISAVLLFCSLPCHAVSIEAQEPSGRIAVEVRHDGQPVADALVVVDGPNIEPTTPDESCSSRLPVK